MLLVFLLSIFTSLCVSYGMMKLQMKMIEKWMEHFFDEESRKIKGYLSKDK